jgi:hypothetical protein
VASQIFSILYSKDIRKKHKVMSDGFVLYEGSRVSLYDSEGKRIFSGYRNDLNEQDTQIFTCGSYYCK